MYSREDGFTIKDPYSVLTSKNIISCVADCNQQEECMAAALISETKACFLGNTTIYRPEALISSEDSVVFYGGNVGVC